MDDVLGGASATEGAKCLEIGKFVSSQDESRLIILRLFCGIDSPSVLVNL